MVANLSAHKPGWDEKWEFYSKWAEKGQQYKKELLFLVDEDTNAFNKIIDGFRMPKSNEEEITLRKEAIENATKYATEIPFKVMETAYNSMEVMMLWLKRDYRTLYLMQVLELCALELLLLELILMSELMRKILKTRYLLRTYFLRQRKSTIKPIC